MPVFRVEKNRDYTTMSNYHLRDKKLSLKAKGLLSLILSLPDNWNYSISGLAAICKESRDGVNSALQELERNGYLKRNKLRGACGRFSDVEYVIYEKPYPVSPVTDFPDAVVPDVAVPDTENTAVLNTDRVNTELLSTKEIRGARPPCGKYRNVYLSAEDYDAFAREYPYDYEKRIDRLSEYMESSGKKYKNHYLTLCQWAKQDGEKFIRKSKLENYDCGEDESL